MKYTFVLLSLFFFITGCKQQKETQQAETPIIIKPGMTEDLISDLNPYIDTIILLPLETTSNSLVSFVEKMLLLPNGHFIIYSSNQLLVFNSEGKYLYPIGWKGRGPEEYTGISDICLNQDGEILNILTTNEIVSYQIKDGTFLGRVQLHTPSEFIDFAAIASGTNNSFFVFSCRQDHTDSDKEANTLFHFDQAGHLLASYLPAKDYILTMKLITQAYNNKYILRPQDQDNICYYLKDSLPEPRIRIDFGKKTISNKYSPDIQTYLRSDYNKMPINIQETENHFFFTFCGPEALEYYCLYSFSDHKTLTWKRKGNDPQALFLIIGSDQEYFYGLYNDYRSPDEIPLTEIDLLKKAVIERTHPELQEDSNPCLVKIKFK